MTGQEEFEWDERHVGRDSKDEEEESNEPRTFERGYQA